MWRNPTPSPMPAPLGSCTRSRHEVGGKRADPFITPRGASDMTIALDVKAKLEQYADGLITETELRWALRGLVVPPVQRAPSEKTRLRNEAKYLRREMRKIQALRSQRGKVDKMRKALDDLQYEEQQVRR